MDTLNEPFSTRFTRRRYEVWFIRMGLADGSGAWWFRYLLMNPGRGGCPEDPAGMPVQVWATWFPQGAKPQTLIQGFPSDDLELSAKGQSPFQLKVGNNAVGDSSCRGELVVAGHKISWNLHYQSTLSVTLSSKGWIGFSRTPHSDASFSGRISLDGRIFEGNPLGFGVQGHNCGYRHRNFWTWTHAYFLRPNRPPTTLEALVYEMPFGLVFRKAVLWHDGEQYVFRNLRDLSKNQGNLQWDFSCSTKEGFQLEATILGAGPSTHHLSYVKTDCKGSFDVANNSLASAVLRLRNKSGFIETLETSTGAVLERVG